jgi:hypothetical protein
VMRRVKIKEVEDLDKLPEGEIVEVEEWGLDVELIEEKDAKILIRDNEVQLSVDRKTYERIKDKKLSVVSESRA